MVAILVSAAAEKARETRQTPLAMDFRRNIFIKIRRLKIPGAASTKLELAAAGFARRIGDGDAVVKPQQPDRQVQAQAKTPVVCVLLEVPVVRIGVDHADVVKEREADAFDDGHAVFRKAEPVGVAAQRFAETIARPDVAILVAAQGVQSAEEVAIKERHIDVVVVALADAGPATQFEQVPLHEAADVGGVLELDLVKVHVAAAWAAGQLAAQFGALALGGEEIAVARVEGER